MHVKQSGFLAVMATMVAAFAPAAQADTLTLGSTLAAPATLTEAHQADTAFWSTAIAGSTAIAAPADAQVTSVKIKGIVVQPAGAATPLNEVHVQALDPQPDGSMKVYLSSDAFTIPYTGDANQITTFTPNNLCMHKGGVLDFNDEGGWDGTGSGPYAKGAPFKIFGAVAGSSTSLFSKDNGTKNGAVLAPATVLQGSELLMQYTIATGDDRSFECGGPLRDPNGNVIKRMQVTPTQDAYVTADGNFTIFGYCGDAYKDCSGGTATVTVNGKQVASAPFSTPKQTSIKVPMKMSTADYAQLSAQAGGKWTATVTLTTPDQGTVTGNIAMHSSGGGAMHVVKSQRVYVRGNRLLTPAGFCGVSTGCAGTAALSVKGKVVATSKFVSTSRGKITISLRVPAAVYRQLKRKPLLASLAITGPLGSDTQAIILRH